jgi:hypothetical protein
MSAGCVAIGLGLAPISFVWLVLCPHLLLMARVFGDRPVRMDYSLFLRVAEGMCEFAVSESSTAKSRGNEIERKDLLAFARFLGSRWLVINFRWMNEGLCLWLTPVTGLRWGMLEYFRGGSRTSKIMLTVQGEISATLGEKDRMELRRLNRGAQIDEHRLEERVSAAATEAWRNLRAMEFLEAEGALGERSEREVFQVSPARTGLTRWYQRIAAVWAVLAVLLFWFHNFKAPWWKG